MRPFENAKVGDKVYLPNDPKGYEIIQLTDIYFMVEFIKGLVTPIDYDGRTINFPYLGQRVFPHPVTIQDGREPSNCGSHECSMAKYCFGDNPLDYCECPDYWKPKEESCRK